LKLNSKEKKEKIILFKKAWNLYEIEHDGQTRTEINPYTNKPYPFEMHPKQTASILINVGADMENITHSLIHDIGDMTGKNHNKRISEEFGETIGEIYKINTSIIKTKNISEKIKIKKKLFEKSLIEFKNQPRALIGKVADRLQNMLTFQLYNQEQQKRVYKETEKLLSLAKAENKKLYDALKKEISKHEI